MRNDDLAQAIDMIHGYVSRESGLSNEDYLEIQSKVVKLAAEANFREVACSLCSYRTCKSLLDGIVDVIDKPDVLELWDAEGLYKTLLMGYRALRV